MNNFYTLTVYEKGSEVIRMYHTLLGEEGFQKGMKLYFERHDGTAATCEDFVSAMEDATGVDLKQFRLWKTELVELLSEHVSDVLLPRYEIQDTALSASSEKLTTCNDNKNQTKAEG